MRSVLLVSVLLGLVSLGHVNAWEFLPGNTRVVHHATMQFDAAGSSRELDTIDPEPGYEGLVAHSVARAVSVKWWKSSDSSSSGVMM
jgi:hypothetical protein